MSRNKNQTISKFDENYKTTDPKNTMNPKYKRHEKNYTEAHPNGKTNGKEDTLKVTKKTL